MTHDVTSRRTASEADRRLRGRRGTGFLALAFAYGYATNQVPSWDLLDSETMWVNELAAPYAALAWLAGTAFPRSTVTAAVGGVTAVLVAFFGYYTEILVETGGNPFTLLTVANPWLVLELALGVGFGVLGRRWWLCPAPWLAVVAGLVPVLEAAAFATGLTGIDVPALNLYPPTYPWTAWNLAFWSAETAAGVLVGGTLLRRVRG